MVSYEAMLEHLGQTPAQISQRFYGVGQLGYWLYSCESGQYWWSPQIRSILGVSAKKELSLERFYGLVHPEDLDMAQSAFRRAQEGKPFRVTYRIQVGERLRWLEQHGRCYRGAGCPVPYVVGILQDISALRRDQETIDSQRADLAAITNYLAETTDTTDLEAIVSSVKRTIRKWMDVAMIGVFVHQGERFYRVIPKEMDPAQGLMFQDIHDYVAYRTLIDGTKQLCPVENYPSAQGKKSLVMLGGVSVISLPIKHGRQTIGALSVTIKRPGDLRPQEDELCRTICGYLSNQLKSALLYRQLAEELARRERLESDHEAIFNESVDFIMVQDRDGKLVQVNPAFAKRMGHTVQGLIGRSLFDFIHPDERTSARYEFSQMSSCGVKRGACNRFLCGDGTIGFLESNLKYMEQSGDTIVIARDMTHQKRVEAQNLDLVRSIAAERLKGEALAGLSHEFKTPINIILSTLDLVRLKSSREDPARFDVEYARFFGYAYENCYKLLRLSANLIDSSRLESGLFQMRIGPNDLSALLPEIVCSAEAYAAARELSLDFQSQVEGALWAECDADALDRIMLNLTSNAIKNTPPGGSIQVQLLEEEDCCQIIVADSGVGIPPEMIDTIFDKFQTGKPQLSGQQEGSGLGLSLVDTLVKKQGGSISVESTVGVGSRFFLTLPKSAHNSTTENLQPQRAALELRAKMELSELRV